MDDLHEAEFSWPYGNASDVILTGSFDHWSCTMHLPKGASGFVGNVRVPWNEKVPYKFIVDGKWVTRNDRPTELDGAGNLNNVLIAPSKPTPITEHPSATAPKGPTDTMTSATTLPEELLLSSETSPQKASEANQQGGITESDSNPTNAVDDVGVPDKEVVSIHVPNIIVESAEPPASSSEADTFHTILDTATSAASHVSEEVTSALEYVSSGISYIFSSTPRASADNVNILGTTEQPSTTSAIEPIVAEVLAESAPDVTEPAPQIAPVVPILILPVNDHMLNESTSPNHRETDTCDPSVSDSLDATIPTSNPSTHSPIFLSKPVPSVTQEIQAAEQHSQPTKGDNSEAQAPEEKNGELLVDAVALSSDAAATSTTSEIDVNPDPAQTTDSDASAIDTGLIAPNNEPSLPAPEPQDTPEVTTSSMPSNDDPKDSKEVSFPASTTTNSTVIPSSSKFSTASAKKKRRSLFAKLREFLSHKKTKK